MCGYHPHFLAWGGHPLSPQLSLFHGMASTTHTCYVACLDHCSQYLYGLSNYGDSGTINQLGNWGTVGEHTTLAEVRRGGSWG